MKKNILRIAILLTAAVVGLYACERDVTLKSPTDNPAGSAYLRIIDAAPGFRSVYNAPDSFNVYVNSTKVSGFTPGGTYLMTFGATFPTSSSLNGYVAVPAGTSNIKLTFGGTLTGDSIPITTFTKTLAADQYYSFIITDSIKSTRDSSQIFIQDVLPASPVGYYNLRFVNAVWNDTAGKNGTVDIWSTRTNRTIFSAVKPGGITAFSAWPYNTVYSDTLIVRRSNSLIALDTLSGVSFSNQRSYTLYYRGDGTTKPNTVPASAKGRHLATYVNY